MPLEMKQEKQVNKTHYEFAKYMNKARWNSVWHQIDEMARFSPNSVLEIGPGPGLFKSLAGFLGIKVETLDLDVELQPDYVASATAMPIDDSSFDVVCAFQMLEHLPYKESLCAFSEMARVSRGKLIISLPDARPMWHYRIQVPKLGVYEYLIPRPFYNAPIHEFDGEHYWEISKRDYPLSRIIEDFSQYAPLLKTYRVKENPYHRFFIFGEVV